MVDWSSLSVMAAVLAAVGGYLCGSIPFGLLLTRWAGLGDVRQIGSGNIGATNVLRTRQQKDCRPHPHLGRRKGDGTCIDFP